jgi:hypothetical protein
LRDAGYRIGAVLPADADLHERRRHSPDVLVAMPRAAHATRSNTVGRRAMRRARSCCSRRA